MRKLYFICFLLITSNLGAQSLSEANEYFEKYEYKKAAQIFSECSKNKRLSLENYKRMAYSYFTISEFDQSYPLTDSLTKLKAIEPYFIYMHGMASMYKGNFTQAKELFSLYKIRDDKFDVDVLIKSCDSIPLWKPIDFKENKLFQHNGTKADLSGQKSLNGFFIFQEDGKDSLGRTILEEQVDASELLTSEPFYVINNEVRTINIQSTLESITLTSLANFPKTNDVIVTIADLLSADELKRAPHLYSAKLDTINNLLTDIQPWIYSGFEDSSACAHATINESGTKIVFTKMGKNTKSADLYISNFENGSWSKPVSLISLNTSDDDMYPLFSGDSILTFSSNGRAGYGSLDIYKTLSKGLIFSDVSHFSAPINSFSDDFNFTYITKESGIYSSNRNGGIGDDDIYEITFKPVVIDTKKDNYDRFVKNWVDQKVYFDYAKFSLKKDIYQLDSLVAFLKNNPTCKIAIEAHTDSRGETLYNLYLSDFRAKNIKSELVERGISENQIIAVPKGETEPQVKCKAECTENEHALNRVAIIKLKLP
jgi:hypothetical protein